MAAGCVAFLYAAAQAARSYDVSGATLAGISFWVELLLLVGTIIAGLRRGGFGFDFTFGSARFATFAHAHTQGLFGTTGIRLGYFRHPAGGTARSPDGQPLPLHYTGERHLLTVAPTRAGKGVSTIIPNLLAHQGSAIIIDPKGENARTTARRRSQLGIGAWVLDPWGISGFKPARFNPLDMLKPDSPTLIEDATVIAEALVIPETGGNGKHFSEQASDLIKGFLIYLAIMPGEVRTLGRLRAILTMPPKELAQVGIAMAKSPHAIVRSAAAQFITKSETERLGVLSTAQRNTHFLDSPALQASLAASDFKFADLKGKEQLSIYLVLPVDRLTSHSRWLRLLIAQAIAELARTPAKPPRPVLFMLDEFAQLGRMPIIEDAYGLMAGMGLQLHVIFQDLARAKRLYGEGWQTFAANAGVMQFFGTRDLFTAQYVSSLIGMTTRTVRSSSTTSGSSSGTSGTQHQSGSNSSSSVSFAPTQRPLLFPDELMRMDRNAQVLFVENADPVLADKITWHEEADYRQLAGAQTLAALKAVHAPTKA
ncbi:type IV secretory system conjugative DNA transfer family protein [Sphingomonas sp.]|uniref:type IV secretory system conjugative DNA transfer family protein n=1 Tax=Sphingomonas sp. TaxID=28214 RepID=UPI0035BC0E12